MKKNYKLFFAALIFLFFSSNFFASESASTAYLEGCKAFSRGEWNSAVFLLKKAASYSENDNPDTHYMMISAEIYAEDYKNALDDCEDFLRIFPESIYVPRIQYMKGKLLYNLGEYEKSIVVLSDFCHRNEENELYPSALFYIAECLFTDYKYDEAEAIYERIVTQFPSSEKVNAAQYRIENIAQRSREEKLLYLLKQTGEEYLSAKEEYEKQLKLYNSDAINSTRDKLMETQQKNKDLEEQIKNLEAQIETLKIEQLLYQRGLNGNTETAALDQPLENAEIAKDAEVTESAEKTETVGDAEKADANSVSETDDKNKTSEDDYNENEAVKILKAKAFLIQQLLNEQNAAE